LANFSEKSIFPVAFGSFLEIIEKKTRFLKSNMKNGEDEIK